MCKSCLIAFVLLFCGTSIARANAEDVRVAISVKICFYKNLDRIAHRRLSSQRSLARAHRIYYPGAVTQAAVDIQEAREVLPQLFGALRARHQSALPCSNEKVRAVLACSKSLTYECVKAAGHVLDLLEDTDALINLAPEDDEPEDSGTPEHQAQNLPNQADRQPK